MIAALMVEDSPGNPCWPDLSRSEDELTRDDWELKHLRSYLSDLDDMVLIDPAKESYRPSPEPDVIPGPLTDVERQLQERQAYFSMADLTAVLGHLWDEDEDSINDLKREHTWFEKVQ